MNHAAPARALEGSPLDVVTGLAAGVLRIPVAAVGPDDPLARLGLDSLACMELAARIEETLGRPLPAEAIVESATIRSLCEALEQPLPSVEDPFARMRADAVLPADLVPMRRRRASTDLRDARTILLTGATGFLGTSLLRALLSQTSARIICLVRPTHEEASSRTRRVLGPFASDDGRVETIDADLAVDRVGLRAAEWHSLAARIDAICHAGASINWVAPYESLRAVNVLATRDLLRLASEAGAAFHFVSSLSVCYSSAPLVAQAFRPAAPVAQAFRPAPRRVDERAHALDRLEGLHFGYAQTKAVAEALVAEARRRGLPARIYRPAIISGDAVSGRFNPDDILSRLIAGCVRMTTAPDLDWALDAIPVDCVADAIVRLSRCRQPVFHLTHQRPRHWREVALWLRLYGYDIRLIPYREWTDQLRHEASLDLSHPLRPLRSFFLETTSAGLSIPELHETPRRAGIDATASMRALSRTGGRIATLDAALMDRYVDAFIREGTLPPVHASRRRGPQTNRTTSPALALARTMLETAGIPSRNATIVEDGAGDSIISELTAWQSRSSCGIYRVVAGERDLLLKIKPHARDAIAVGQALAGLCSQPLGAAYERWGASLGVEHGHAREVAIYQEQDAAFRAHLPGVLATHADPASGVWAVLLERVPDRPTRWLPAHIDPAIDGLAVLHARSHRRTEWLRRQPWISVRSTAQVEKMTPLWHALAAHAAPLFAASAGPGLPTESRRLIDRIPVWRAAGDALPQTLIHNDFNSRNIRLRPPLCVSVSSMPLCESSAISPRLCAFDWELATIGAPTRDLAELLCFVCPSHATRKQVDRWIERHRRGFRAGTGGDVDPVAWRAGVAAALCELLVDRLAVYALVHRVKPQPFLPRVLRTWSMLFRMTNDALAL